MFPGSNTMPKSRLTSNYRVCLFFFRLFPSAYEKTYILFWLCDCVAHIYECSNQDHSSISAFLQNVRLAAVRDRSRDRVGRRVKRGSTTHHRTGHGSEDVLVKLFFVVDIVTFCNSKEEGWGNFSTVPTSCKR